jgi:hypothetical protein
MDLTNILDSCAKLLGNRQSPGDQVKMSILRQGFKLLNAASDQWPLKASFTSDISYDLMRYIWGLTSSEQSTLSLLLGELIPRPRWANDPDTVLFPFVQYLLYGLSCSTRSICVQPCKTIPKEQWAGFSRSRRINGESQTHIPKRSCVRTVS